METKFNLSCPHCGVSGMAPTSLAGRKIKCRRCGQTFEAQGDVTGSAEEAPAPPPHGQPSEPASAPSTPPEPPTPSLPQSELPLPVPQLTPPPPNAPAATPPPPLDAEPADARSVAVRANRVLAGKICPGCTSEVLLGEEVVRCEKCGAVSHSRCWEDHGGCSASRCAGPEATLDRASTRPCPACAEQIPADSKLCSYCAEPIANDGGGDVLPISFITGKGELFVTNWSFTASSTELVGNAPGKEEIRVLRERAQSEITLTARKMVIVIDGKKRKFTIDDIGHMAMRSFLGEKLVPRSSVMARDALVSAIVGIFCCQIILGPYAYFRGGRAKEMINLYPEAISGRGLATAAQIIGVIDLVLAAFYVIGNVMKAAG